MSGVYQVPKALPLGKLTIIVGAGLVGSVLAKEGRMSNVFEFFSGVFKFRSLRQESQTGGRLGILGSVLAKEGRMSKDSDFFSGVKKIFSTTSSSKPKNDSLMQQVRSLREEFLACHRSVMIVNGGRSGSSKYGVVVVVVVVGYGYARWKGWKLSEMMLVTRRGLNDACSCVGKQLETVYSSILATRKHLSSRIDDVGCKIDGCADNTSATKEEVSELRGDVNLLRTDVQFVNHVVRSLETKISRIEGRQNEINFGVGQLVHFVRNPENESVEQIEALFLPESPSPSNAIGSRSKQAFRPPSNSLHSASGLKEMSSFGWRSLNLPPLAPATRPPEDTMFGRTFSGIDASVLTRSRRL